MNVSSKRLNWKLFGAGLLLTISLLSSAARATPVIVTVGGGFLWDSLEGDPLVATAAPGSPFTIDYSSSQAAISHVDIATVLLGFECHTPFTTVSIVLDSDPTVYSFPPTDPATSEFAMLYYNSDYGIPAGSIPANVFPQGWMDELADNEITGRIWVEGVPFQPQFVMLSAQTGFVVPEPASSAVLAVGGLIMLRLRRK